MNRESTFQIDNIVDEILSDCRSIAFDGKSPVYAPDSKGFYKGMYWRDFCYTLEGLGGSLSIEDIEFAIRYLLDPLPQEHGILHKCRTTDGQVEYNWQDPNPTVNSPWDGSTESSSQFSADNPMFAVKVIDEYLKLGGKICLFEKCAEKLHRVMSEVALSDNYLVKDDVGPYVYGFYDTISLTGEECFASVLFYDAGVRLSEMFRKIGDLEKADLWRRFAGKTHDGIKNLWIEEQGMFLSDTGTNRQIDIWGSAFANYVGIVSDEQAVSMSKWFVKNYQRCIRWGHVRHLPYPEYWKGVFTNLIYPKIQPYGHYQNGGYWSVPAPWVAHTISLTDPSLAKRMISNLKESLTGCYMPECINEDGSCKLPGYTASAAMGLLAIRMFV